MEDSTYRVIEVVGTSPDGVTEAMNSGVARVAATTRQLEWLEVQGIRGHIEDGRIAHFQVAMKLGFHVEDT